MKTSELLLPVGDMDMCLAAIHNGADAIYVGAPGFNARGRTKDHDLTELKQMIDLCHLYGVKVHLAFNILIFEDEMQKIKDYIRSILSLSPDALIVQDLGLAWLVKQMAPWQVLHASTQMTITNDLAISEVDDLDFKRFVLGRECSLPEIKIIRESTDKELEVFVHGALCVAYSGQCFTSEAIGGRSANRGQCAQSCRLEYELIVDGVKANSHKGPYAVSPKDLMGLAQVNELQKIGVESFKVEGRLKGPDYVASVAKNYRDVLKTGLLENFEQKKKELERTYSRGFYSGWLEGVEHQQLVGGSYSSHRGQYIGTIEKIEKNKVVIKTKESIDKGCGLLFSSLGSGSFVYQAQKTNETVTVELAKDFLLSKLSLGEEVYLNKDPALEKELAQSWKDKEKVKRIPIKINVSLAKDQKIKIRVIDDQKNTIEIQSEQTLTEAKDKAASKADIKKGLCGFGATAFKVEEIEVELENGLFVPNQILKSLRKEITRQLIQKRVKPTTIEFNDVDTSIEIKAVQDNPKTNVLLRDQEQLIQFLHAAQKDHEFNPDMIGNITLDYEFGKHYQESLKLLRDHGFKAGIATTRILKPKELHNLKVIERLSPDEILVRNLGALHYFKDKDFTLRADFSFNVTNSLSAKYLKDKSLESITMGLDLNQWQVDDILKHCPGEWFEVIVHQHMPEFHMEHCVFAAYLSQGTSFKDCGKPCEKHKVSLKDHYGNIHHLAADHECRNTMFKAEAQVAVSQVADWQSRGIQNFRLEGLWEDGAKLLEKTRIFQHVLKQTTSHQQALKQLGVLERFGVSAGVLAKRDNYTDRKKHP